MERRLRRKQCFYKSRTSGRNSATNECLKTEIEEVDDDLETTTEKCFAYNDFGKEEESWYRCTGCRIWVHGN